MRDPGRIWPFLKTLQVLWEQTPDLRFGQLIMNLSREPHGFSDIWEWDVEEFQSRMAKVTAEQERT